ncbi:F-box family protein-like protein [Rhynchospora pubera]|uniref:F-box family protein-like protein n=1 Tax=Rhynchospora pubera TaxID=906938 RepID=A0AAV8FZT5_9POAL|nr:F-box family protein-like protein [Rhynchospora pubera]
MADGRLKAVAHDLEDEEEMDGEEEGETEGEELDLSLFTAWRTDPPPPPPPRRHVSLLYSRDWDEMDEVAATSRESNHKRARVFDSGESSQYTGIPSGDLSFSQYTDMNYLHNLPYDDVERQDEAGDGGIDMATHDLTDENVPDAENPNVGNVEQPQSELRMDLTDDLLYLIFSFLGQKDLCRAGASCKQWHAASSHEDFWRSLKFDNIQITLENFVSICLRYHQNVKELNLSGVPRADVLFMEAASCLSRLETLTLGKGHLSDAFFQELSELPALINLSICDSALGGGINEATIQHDRLRNLHIVKCRSHRIAVRCPQLLKLSMKRSSMSHVTLHSPQLRELDLSSCHKLSDAAIRAAAVACPKLTSLDTSFCSCVTDETLREISQACLSLSSLDASNCHNISFESVKLSMLVDLKLHSCEGITSASMAAIAQSRLLEALQLDNCSLLTSVSLDLPHLRKISLVHLRKFVELNLRSPVLQYIKVSRCSALQRINIISNSLQKLVLQKQESLVNLSLQCYSLVDVDLSDCESLTNSICDVFSKGGGCPMLRSLVLDNCESLSVVEIRSCSLVNLSLAGCRTMTSLKLSCPSLKKVNLDGCDHLEVANFSPVGLESLNLGICPKLDTVHIEAPIMTTLELKGCGVLSKASIKCPCLVSLDASFCRQFVDGSLSGTVVDCPLIEQLTLSSCLAIGDDGLYSLIRLDRLTLLDLSYTFLINLQPVFDSCSKLKVLKLSACKYLTDSSLDALYKQGALPSLLELDLSYSSIGQNAIIELLANCTNLVNVNLNGCTNLHELVCVSADAMSIDGNSGNKDAVMASWKSERLLEVLNCTGCPNIKKVVITSGANCLHLLKINLNLSTNLKEVDLACSNLSILNLSNCTSLEILKLDCPRLTNLQLPACTMLAEDELEGAISHCNLLESLNINSCNKMNLEDFERLRSACPSLKRIQGGSLGGI